MARPRRAARPSFAGGSDTAAPKSAASLPARNARCSAQPRVMETLAPPGRAERSVTASPSLARSRCTRLTAKGTDADTAMWNEAAGNSSRLVPASSTAPTWTRTRGSGASCSRSHAQPSSSCAMAKRTTRSCTWSARIFTAASKSRSTGCPSWAIVTTNWGTVNVRPGDAARKRGWAMRWAAFACWASPLFRLLSHCGRSSPWCQAKASRTGISSPPRV